MKKQTQHKLVWPVGMFAVGVALLVSVAGCIRISVNVTESHTSISGDKTPTAHPPTPPIGGGSFVPEQGTGVDLPGGSICGQTVNKKIVFTYVTNGVTNSFQTPPSGTKGFLGTIKDLNNSNALIDNSHFILQVFASALKKNCCTNVLGSTTQVGTNVWGVTPVSFTAYFRPGFETEAGHQLQLDGEWTK